MFLDGIHAIRSGSSLDIAESAKINLTFALLPIFTHGAFSLARKTLARDTYSGLQKAKNLEKRGAKQEAEKVISDVMKHVKEEQRILSKIELDAIRAVDGFIPE